MLNFPPVSIFADRKKIRETNPNEEKFPEVGGVRPLQPPGINPIINSTSSPNMALISNALAAYNYISGDTLNWPPSGKDQIPPHGSSDPLSSLVENRARSSYSRAVSSPLRWCEWRWDLSVWFHVCYMCVLHYLWVISPISFFPGTERRVNEGWRNADVWKR